MRLLTADIEYLCDNTTLSRDEMTDEIMSETIAQNQIPYQLV